MPAAVPWQDRKERARRCRVLKQSGRLAKTCRVVVYRVEPNCGCGGWQWWWWHVVVVKAVAGMSGVCLRARARVCATNMGGPCAIHHVERRRDYRACPNQKLNKCDTARPEQRQAIRRCC